MALGQVKRTGLVSQTELGSCSPCEGGRNSKKNRPELKSGRLVLG